MPKAKPFILALVLCAGAAVLGALLAGCEPQPAARVVGCAISDEKLSVAFTDPKRAKAYLEGLGARLKANEPGSIAEAAELAESIAACLR